VRDEGERPKRPGLPDGYRVVAIASDHWVLLAPNCTWVTNYHADLDLWRASLDARRHNRSGE